MLPYGTEVRSVPRFAVDQEAATAHPGLVCLHDEEDDVLLCSQQDLPPY